MRILRAFFVALLLALAAEAQTAPVGRLVLVLPFENNSKAPGLDWISESFPEVLGERMSSAGFFVIGRDDRLYAFDRLGLPATVHPSRAMVIRIAQEMDVDYVVLGSFSYDGSVFSTSAQVLDVKSLHLRPMVSGSGPLPQLVLIQSSISWDLLRDLDPGFTLSRETFVNSVPAVRLDAFEDYLRGVLATSRTDKISYLKQALKLNPSYSGALLQLGRTYFDGNEYDAAEVVLSRVPHNDLLASEANFLLGLSYYYTENFPKAEEAFQFVNSRFPLTEVVNNLGVVADLRGNTASAIDFFRRAVKADSNDPDYHFNLAVALAASGDMEGAQQEAKQCLSLQADDPDAKSLSGTLAASRPAGTKPELPEPRAKHNFDQSSFLQAELEVQEVTRARLATQSPQQHAQGLVDIGRQLLAQGFPLQAERDLREALALDAKNASAHLAMASLRKSLNDTNGARSEAQQSIALHPSADAYVLLAEIDRDQNNTSAARQDVSQALQLEPTHAEALSIERALNAKSSSGGRRIQ